MCSSKSFHQAVCGGECLASRCANSLLRCSFCQLATPKAKLKHLENTQEVLHNHPECSEERVHGRCVGEAKEGFCSFLDAGRDENAVGGPADGVGDWLFSKLGIKVPKVTGSTLLQEGERNMLSIKKNTRGKGWGIPSPVILHCLSIIDKI